MAVYHRQIMNITNSTIREALTTFKGVEYMIGFPSVVNVYQ